MLKEKVKNAIIFLCILNALFLTGRIWFNEKLWSSDYNFFVFTNPASWFSRFFPDREESYSMPKESLSRPRRIVVNAGNEMTVFYNSDPAFEEINETLQAVLVPLLKGKAAEGEAAVSSMEEWYAALANRSIYAEYTLSYTPELFANIQGVRDATVFSSLAAIRDYMIAPGEDGREAFFIREADAASEPRVLKFRLKEEYRAAYPEERPSEDELYFFAFDLGLSAASAEGDAPEQSVVLSPMVLISANEISASRVYSTNPMISGGVLDEEAVSRILARFGSGARASRNYTDSDGNQVYVENSGTLKLYRDGMIEYQALSPDRGIRVQDTPGGTLYSALNSTIDFVEAVWAGAIPGEAINVCVSGDLSGAQIDSSTYRFTFDYYVAGNPVQTELSAKGSRDEMKHAVEVVISNGSIISYRHFVRRFREEGTAHLLPMIDALNNILSQETDADNPGRITDMFLSYVEDGSGKELLPEWCVTFENTDTVLRYGREVSP